MGGQSLLERAFSYGRRAKSNDVDGRFGREGRRAQSSAQRLVESPVETVTDGPLFLLVISGFTLAKLRLL